MTDELYIDPIVKKEFETIKKNVTEKDRDWVCVVDGEEGCQPAGSKVLMANGEFKNIEDVKVGDLILSPQECGTHIFSKVLKTYQWYSKENYDVVELNRRKNKLYSCSYNHKIPLNYKIKPRIKGKRLTKDHYWVIKHYKAKDYSKLGIRTTKKNSTAITSFPILKFYDRKNCNIEPYTFGVFLGDGSFCRSNLSITSNDIEILNEVEKYYSIMRVSSKKGTTAKQYNFSKLGKLGKSLIKIGLFNKRSGSKFIPKEALLSDLEYRKRLLAGLIDTDGYLSRESSYSITTKSKQLAKDILFLVYSLGGRGSIRKIKKGIKRLNFVGEYYRVSFYLGDINLPLQLKRKIRNNKFFYLSANRTSIDVKLSKPSVVYGFTLNSKSGWYITDNFMITHNSGKSVLAMQLAKFLNPKFSIRDICFNADQFIDRVRNSPKFLPIVMDEAFSSANTRASLSEVNRAMIGLATEMRQRNLYVIIVIPSFFDLDKYFALWRCRCLFHVVFRRDGRRGMYYIYPKTSKKFLYLNGKKTYDYRKPSSPYPVCRFNKYYPVDEAVYRHKKAEAFKKRSTTNQAKRWKGQRDALVNEMYHNLNIRSLDIPKLMLKWGQKPISQREIQKIVQVYGDIKENP